MPRPALTGHRRLAQAGLAVACLAAAPSVAAAGTLSMTPPGPMACYHGLCDRAMGHPQYVAAPA
jgi:hypothetical protein